MTEQATPADPLIDLVGVLHDDLARRVVAFGAADLARQSGCREWDVSRVLGHLGSAAEIGLDQLEATIEGRDPTDYHLVWDRWDGLGPEARATGFLETGGALVDRYKSLDAATRSALRFDLPFLPEPAGLDMIVGFRLNELTLHSWDVVVAFDEGAELHPEATAVLIDRVGPVFKFLGHADAVDGRLDIAVDTVRPTRSFGLRIADEVLITDTPNQPDGRLAIPTESWLRLTYGRLDAQHTPTGVVFESGSLSLDDLRRVFPGV
jgi:uncharacterized protein (TIGR03083 family)